MAWMDQPAPPQPTPAPAEPRPSRVTISGMLADDWACLDRLLERFGKDQSEVFRMGLKSLEGNQRLFRHAMAQWLNSIILIAGILRARARDDEEREDLDAITGAVRKLEELFAPPDPSNRGA